MDLVAVGEQAWRKLHPEADGVVAMRCEDVADDAGTRGGNRLYAGEDEGRPPCPASDDEILELRYRLHKFF